MRFNTPAPENLVSWYRKGVPGGGVRDSSFERLKAKLTGGKYDGIGYFKLHSRALTQQDADYLINNMKQDEDGYPQLETGSTSGVDEARYQEWLIERYLEVPFREQTDEKIRQAEVRTKVKEIIKIDEETAEVAPVVEEAPQLVAVVEDKIDALEAIREDIAPPRSEYQPPEDPWGEGTIPPKVEATVKKTKKKAKKRKKRKTAPEASQSPKKKPFVSKMGGSVRKTTGRFNGVFDFMEKGSPGGENQGPSVLAIGAFFGRKIQTAFDEAAEERARAVEAEENGAEIPPEMKEKGYFLKKSLGYQFGGEAINKTVGAFVEELPSKQSRKKAGFGDTFDYGDSDPRKQKRQDSVKDLATGFRKVDRSLRQINSSLSKNAGILSQLVAENKRTADAAEAIAQQLAKGVDLEIQTGDAAQQAQQAAEGFDSPINFILGGKKSDRGILDILFALDDVRDIARGFRGSKSKGRGKTNITGDINGRNRMRNLNPFNRPGGNRRITGNTPKFRFPRRLKFSEGAAITGAVPALVGEAGPEIVDRAGVRETLPKGFTPDKSMVNPFVKVMETPMMVVGAQISDAISAVVQAAGPFSGVLASMFSPMTSGLAQLFGIPQSAFAADLKSASLTEEKGAKSLGGFLAPIFRLFGLEGDSTETKTSGPGTPGDFPGGVKGVLDLIASVESNGSYDVFNTSYGATPGKATEKTIGWLAQNAQGAIGRYQHMPQFIMDRALGSGYNADTLFTPDVQDAITVKMLEDGHGLKEFLAGTLSAEKFAAKLAPTWRGLPQGPAAAASLGGNADSTYMDRYASGNAAHITWADTIASLDSIRNNIPAEKGIAKTASFMNKVDGIWRMEGPTSGYRVPTELTGDKKVVGHGLEWLMKFPNKFVILPGVNKAYNVYANPEKAFDRYKTIASNASVDQEGLTDTMSQIIFGMPVSETKPERVINKRGREISRQLPDAKVTPVAIPKDTATGTVGGQTIAIVQPTIQYVPVPGPVETVVETVPANVFAAARKNADMQYLQSLS
jgi:hypothetical protein